MSDDQDIPADDYSLLLRRAERLRAPHAEVVEDDALFWVARFLLGEEHFAFPLSALKAAMPLRLVTPVPLAPPHVIGVVRFQGEAIAVLSLASLLGRRAWSVDPSILLVVEPEAGRLVAFECGEIPHSIALPREAARALDAGAGAEFEPITVADSGSSHRARRPDEIVNLIHLDRLFDPTRRRQRGGA